MAVVAGAVRAVSLVGYGIESFIEVTSGSVLLWRMAVDADVHRRERNADFLDWALHVEVPLVIVVGAVVAPPGFEP